MEERVNQLNITCKWGVDKDLKHLKRFFVIPCILGKN